MIYVSMSQSQKRLKQFEGKTMYSHTLFNVHPIIEMFRNHKCLMKICLSQSQQLRIFQRDESTTINRWYPYTFLPSRIFTLVHYDKITFINKQYLYVIVQQANSLTKTKVIRMQMKVRRWKYPIFYSKRCRLICMQEKFAFQPKYYLK